MWKVESKIREKGPSQYTNKIYIKRPARHFTLRGWSLVEKSEPSEANRGMGAESETRGLANVNNIFALRSGANNSFASPLTKIA